MITILVTTDFSTNSKAGIRFALQLASQTPCKLVFYHAIELLVPTLWRKEEAIEFVESKRKLEQANLGRFLNTILQKSKKPYTPFECVAEPVTNIDKGIIEFAQKVEADFICMSTSGAGTLKKIIGTNASSLVNTSPIPVIIVPKSYRSKPIIKLAYATDLENLDTEMPLIQKLATSTHAHVDVFHFYYQLHKDFNHKAYDDIKTQYQAENVLFHEPTISIEYSLVENLKHVIAKRKSSLLVMFTHQKHNWFERFFFESNTSSMTYDIKILMVAYRK